MGIQHECLQFDILWCRQQPSVGAQIKVFSKEDKHEILNGNS